MKTLAFALLLIILAPALVFAQAGVPGTLTQQSPTMLTACSSIATANGATPTATTATPPPGYYVYVCGIEITLACGTTTCTVVAAQTLGTTNLNSLTFTVPSTGVGSAAGSGLVMYYPSPLPIKANAIGTTVAVGAAPAVTNGNWRINIYGYYAP